jgi:hypothetical protein
MFNTLRRAAKTEQARLAAEPITAVLSATSKAPDSGPEGVALIVGTVPDGSGAQVHAGQASQRVILNAAVLGVPVTPLRDVLLTDAHRQAVRALLGGGLWPQAVLRTTPLPATSGLRTLPASDSSTKTEPKQSAASWREPRSIAWS